MKKTLTGVMMLLAGACVSHAQGTVSFGNYAALNTYIYVSYQPASGSAVLLGGSATGATPSLNNYSSLTGNGSDWTVELLGAAGANDSASSLSPLMQATAPTTPVTASFATGNPDGTPGTWASSEVALVPGTIGGSAVTLELEAWYNDGGTITSYSAAQGDGVPAGVSPTANSTTGGLPASGPSITQTALPSSLGPFNVTTVPEPSTVALGVMGASALMLRLRRK